jgi:hypothetical protein
MFIPGLTFLEKESSMMLPWRPINTGCFKIITTTLKAEHLI